MKNLKVLVAPDKFRPKMTAARVCKIVKETLAGRRFDVECVPLADGG